MKLSVVVLAMTTGLALAAPALNERGNAMGTQIENEKRGAGAGYEIEHGKRGNAMGTEMED